MSNEQNGQRRHFPAPKKAAILREHFLDHVPISQICDKYGLNPTMFYRWQKELFEKATSLFELRSERGGPTSERRVKVLTDKLTRKDEVIAELMEDHLRLKKNLGEV